MKKKKAKNLLEGVGQGAESLVKGIAKGITGNYKKLIKFTIKRSIYRAHKGSRKKRVYRIFKRNLYRNNRISYETNYRNIGCHI
jgi:hypothetical protein